MKRGQETNHIRKQEAGTQDTHETGLTVLFDAVQFVKLKIKFKFSSVQVELYCHSATCGDIQWNEMSCLTGPRCYINTDIQQ